MPGKKKFISKIGLKKGALSRQLGIPEKKNIPKTLLNKIVAAKAGQTITNPSKSGKRRIKVTRLLERRAILARTLKGLPKRFPSGRKIPTRLQKQFIKEIKTIRKGR